MSEQAPNEEALLLACTALARSHDRRYTPLGPKGWASLGDRLRASGMEPTELLPMTAADIERRAGIAPERAEQLAGLFARRGQLAFELERLERLGIWYLTLAGEHYPDRLRARLGDAAPPVLFGLGEAGLLERRGLGVVGSRDAPPTSLELARMAGAQAAGQGWATVSGAARGVDQEAMRGAFTNGGPVVGITADGLERHLRDAALRRAFSEGLATYLTPYQPDARFSVGAALGRNKLIYCLADAVLVVHTADGSGGTWAGAVEAVSAAWVPIYVGAGEAGPGASRLLERGARPLPEDGIGDLPGLANVTPNGTQQTLFTP